MSELGERIGLYRGKIYSELHGAVCLEDLQQVKSLIEKGYGVNECDVTGMTALQYAALKGNQDCVEVLLRAGAHLRNPHRLDQPIHIAARGGFVKVVQLLLDHGDGTGGLDSKGKSPLDCAVESSRPDVVNLLLKRGAYVELRTIKMAMKLGFVDIATRLIHCTEVNGDGINADNETGDVPLNWCILYRQPEMLDLLLSKGACIQACTIRKAIVWGQVDMLKTMLLFEPSVLERFELRKIMFRSRSLPCLQLLLSAGFRFNLNDFTLSVYRSDEDDDAFQEFLNGIEKRRQAQSLMKLAQWSFYSACGDTPVRYVVDQLECPKTIISFLCLDDY
ncbi:Ankyrin-1 [Halotydeus destructor]|nr:Ankyrin-1 [Halotydeus destructor]